MRYWFLLPVSALLLALIGFLVPAFWKTPTVAVSETSPNEPSAVCGLPSPTPVETSGQGSADEGTSAKTAPTEAGPAAAEKPLTYDSLWPFAALEKQKSCEYLARNQAEQPQGKSPDPCSVYSPWIAYLTLEASPVPTCNLDRVFAGATEAIEKRNLCGHGYAFLAVYYSYKRVLDRSRSFLEQALQLSPKDPWVKIAEAVIQARDLRDGKQAAEILQDLLRKEPSFSLAQYHLARIYTAEEDYGKAKGLFLLLERTFPHQPGFTKIHQSLASIEQAPYYSAVRAKGLLQVSRAFSELTDYPIAGRLCRKVLEDMAGTLTQAEKKSAFYDLGRISEITGDRETAFACYQNALRIDPSYRDARERMGSLLKGGAQTS